MSIEQIFFFSLIYNLLKFNNFQLISYVSFGSEKVDLKYKKNIEFIISMFLEQNN